MRRDRVFIGFASQVADDKLLLISVAPAHHGNGDLVNWHEGSHGIDRVGLLVKRWWPISKKGWRGLCESQKKWHYDVNELILTADLLYFNPNLLGKNYKPTDLVVSFHISTKSLINTLDMQLLLW